MQSKRKKWHLRTYHVVLALIFLLMCSRCCFLLVLLYNCSIIWFVGVVFFTNPWVFFSGLGALTTRSPDSRPWPQSHLEGPEPFRVESRACRHTHEPRICCWGCWLWWLLLLLLLFVAVCSCCCLVVVVVFVVGPCLEDKAGIRTSTSSSALVVYRGLR